MKKNIYYFFLVGHFCIGMQIHEYRIDLFDIEPVPTEYTAYKLLKDHPLSTPTYYIAIPWTVLINRKLLHTIETSKVNGGFTVCQHILYERIIPVLKEMGITVLFTPHASKSKTYGSVRVLPFPHIQKYGVDPASKKDIYYSFIGFASHAVRGPIFTMNHPDNCIVKRRYNWHFWFDKQKQNMFGQEYMDVLARSRFALCPRGTGPSTIRFWEALQAGAIPVLLADDMSLPEEVNWDQAIVRIAEKDVYTIHAVLSKISVEQEEQMRRKCLEIHQQFSGENFVSTIRHYYDHV